MGVFQKQPTSSSPWAVANVHTDDDAAGPYRMTTTTAPDNDEEYYCDDATLASTPSIRQTFEFGSKHTTIVRDCGEPTDIIFGEQTSSSSKRRRKRKDEVLVLLKKTVKLLVLVCRFLKRKSSSNENHQDWYDGFDEMEIQPPTTAVLV